MPSGSQETQHWKERQCKLLLSLLSIKPTGTETACASGSVARTQPVRCHGTSNIPLHGSSIGSMPTYHHLTFRKAAARTEAAEASFAGS